MEKYVILLPIRYNDGTAIPAFEFDEAIGQLYDLAAGYTLEGHVKGAYRMKSGHKQEDELMKLSVAIPDEFEEDLRNLVRGFCRRFQQECIWFEKSNSVIELVEPNPDGDDHE